MKTKNPTNLHVVELRGPPFERGEMYGETLRAQIREHAGRFMDYIAQGTNQQPDRYIKNFIAINHFERAVRGFTPDLWDEIKGIAQGADISFDTIFALQLLDEEWWYRNEAGGVQQVIPDMCTAFGAIPPAAADPFIAQTMDILGYNNGLQTVLKIIDSDSELETLVLTSAGTIALNGLNSAPLAVCMNTLMALRHSAYGLPVAFVVRGILRCSSMAEAVSFLKSIRHASGQSYLIAGREQIVNYECSADGCTAIAHDQTPSIFCHTNHPLTVHAGRTDWPDQENSNARMAFLIQELGSLSRPMTIRDAQELMRSHHDPVHPICRHRNSSLELMTFAASVMALGPTPEMRISNGPPCQAEYLSFRFEAAV